METGMMITMAAAILLALILGYVIGHLQGKTRYDDLKANHEEQIRQLRNAHHELKIAQEERHKQDMSNLQATFDHTIANLREKMENTTAEMLKQRQQEFSEASRNNLFDLVAPLNRTIADMKDAMQNYSERQAEFSGAMKTNLESIIRQTESTQKSAAELTNALKHNVKAQGDFGETILDELLSKAGLTKGVHYETQFTLRGADGRVLKNEEGEMMRPDVLFHLDQEREVIIDSKVSLTAFVDYVNADNEIDRARFLKAHIDSIRGQVELLSRKDYSQYISATRSRIDYVIMFIPQSAAWWTALNAEPRLWRDAMEKNVFIADEQTLFAALRIIKLTWTQIAQVENQKKVYDLAEEMIDRVGTFMEQYTAMGKALANAQQIYESSMNKLGPNGQSILTTAGKLRRLGARDSGKHPVDKYLPEAKS